MIKRISPANRLPNRTLAEFQHYWGESHGPLWANTRNVAGYIQHLTLPEAYAGNPAPTFDGISIFWYDDLEALLRPMTDPWDVRLGKASSADGDQLFDYHRPVWPSYHQRASVIANEKVVVDGAKTPSMVKLVAIASRHPGLTHDEFFGHWFDVHGPLAAKLPGLRRYVQNHGMVELNIQRQMTHDGWSELWFDDLASLQRAFASPESAAMLEDNKTLFAPSMGIGVARERVQKWPGLVRSDYGVPGLNLDQIRERLQREGYRDMAADPTAPARIKAAADSGDLVLWSDEHLVTNADPPIDARPAR